MRDNVKRPKGFGQMLKKIEGTVLILVFLAVVGYIGFMIFFNPNRMSNIPDEEMIAASTAAEETEETPRLFAEQEVTYKGKKYRRNTYVKAILGIGVDRSDSLEETTTSTFSGQADGIVLVAQDTARNRLKMMMIPRDTMTKIILTDLSGNVLGKDTQHLNLAFAYGDGREKSCEYVAEAVSDLLLGFPIDHYLAADIQAIAIANDLVGGVTVTVPTEGMEAIDESFALGSEVKLHGKQAEQFIRFRDSSQAHTALYRMDQQQEYMEQFYKAFRAEAAADSDLVVRMFDELTAHMVTDMGKEEYLKMAMDALEGEGLTGESIFTLPGQGVTTAAYDEFYHDEEGMIQLVLDLFYREET